MKKRMAILTLLLAGSITFGAMGTSVVQAASQSTAQTGVPATSQSTAQPVVQAASQGTDQTGGRVAAGVTDAFAKMLAENEVFSIAGRVAAEADTLMTETKERMRAAEEAAEQEADVEAHEVPVVESEFADVAIAQVNNYVNVRLEPNTESEILGKLYDDCAATVLEATEDGWYKVESGNVTGYVKAEYVVVGDEELARTVGTRLATVNTTTLFVRTEPTTEAKVLTMLPDGDDVVVTDESAEGWAKVSTEDGDGYVSLEYVSLSTEYKHAESREEEEARLAREAAEREAAARAAEEARRAREAEEAAKRAREAEQAAKSAQQSAAGSSSSESAGSSSSGNAGGGSQASVSNGQAVVNYAMQFLGNPYVYGGNSLTNGTDCSGFVKGVYAAFGISLPRTSAEQRHVGYGVSLSDIQPGDIVCYSGHVGIYTGNNTIIHASNERTGITLTSPVTYRKVLAVRRIF
ncbi:MAG: SH3 domain-containing protein [Roseburia sp.]|nr:SH3 domain-containing protein [Roseburia sp.]